MAEAKCGVCGKTVADVDQQEHLRTNHLGPHYFWFNGIRLRTEEPSMSIAAIKGLTQTGNFYTVFEKRDGGDIDYGDGDTIDLTREPHLWSVPPARY